jgi:hypothetical protein
MWKSVLLLSCLCWYDCCLKDYRNTSYNRLIPLTVLQLTDGWCKFCSHSYINGTGRFHAILWFTGVFHFESPQTYTHTRGGGVYPNMGSMFSHAPHLEGVAQTQGNMIYSGPPLKEYY